MLSPGAAAAASTGAGAARATVLSSCAPKGTADGRRNLRGDCREFPAGDAVTAADGGFSVGGAPEGPPFFAGDGRRISSGTIGWDATAAEEVGRSAGAGGGDAAAA